MQDCTILGIDPGLEHTGYAILQDHQNVVKLLDVGLLKLSPRKSLIDRIGLFHSFTDEKIKHFSVSSLALETPFLGKNIQSFLKLGYLRGILYLLANMNRIKVLEFSPREIKASVTGYGGASKEQVAAMVGHLFPDFMRLVKPETNDETDAIAICLSGFWALRGRYGGRGG